MFEHRKFLQLINVIGEFWTSQFFDLLQQMKVCSLSEILVTVTWVLIISEAKTFCGERIENIAPCVKILKVFQWVE